MRLPLLLEAFLHLLRFLPLLAWLGATALFAERPRNVVVIVADDLGYGDLGCYGATQIKTPNLDRLAANGLRFTQAYAPSAMCTPTRYSLLTGRYAFREPSLRRGVLRGDAGLALDPEEPSLADLMSQAGYRTALIGKWHLGLGTRGKPVDFNGTVAPGPLEVGFDEAFFIPATVDRVPTVFVRDHQVEGLDPDDPIQVSYGGKVGDEPTGRENPELAFRMRPSHGHNDTIVNGIPRIGFMSGGHRARWSDAHIADDMVLEARTFFRANRDQPFFLLWASHEPHVPRVAHPRFAGTSPIGPRGDVIHQLDAAVGELIEELRLLGLLDDTLILFTSDNGNVLDDGYEDGTGDHLEPGDHSPNGDLRGFKVSLAEGGVRVPLIAHWPGRVPVGQTDAIVALVDLMATFGTLNDQTIPDGLAPDSLDFSPVLLGQENTAREEIVIHGGRGALGIRVGDWKLIPSDNAQYYRRGYPSAQEAPKGPELYNLAVDPAEKNNLAATHPEIVTRLAARLEILRNQPAKNQ